MFALGATHAVASVDEAGPLVRDLTRGVMADRVVLTPGVMPTELLSPAMMLTRRGGTCVLTGLSRHDELPVPLVSMYREGRLKLDELVTRRYRLEQINQAVDDMREGRNIRGLIDFSDADDAQDASTGFGRRLSSYIAASARLSR